MGYRNLREYLAALEAAGKLHRVTRPVDKDWEISAVARRVFQRIPPGQRPALFFENVQGQHLPVLVGGLGASRQVYAKALGVEERDIFNSWAQAQLAPREPVVVAEGPCQQVVDLDEAANLESLPIPIWTADHDPAPYITAGSVITKDPDTGGRNSGCYRVQLKGRRKLGMFVYLTHHAVAHIAKHEAQQQATPVAIVIGGPPVVGLTAVAGLPAGVDELAVAGALNGAPLELVRCRTIDLEVPAEADIVIEGLIRPNERELEGPFGEYTGFVGPAGSNYVIDVTAITRRRDAVYQAYISEMPPSESSCIRGIGHEVAVYQHLRHVLNLPVTDVHLREGSGSEAIVVVALDKQHPSQPQQVAWAVWSFNPTLGKYVVVVDSSVDVRNPDAVDWALSFFVQPAKDMVIYDHTRSVLLDPSIAPANTPQEQKAAMLSSKVFIDATQKHAYPAPSLPPTKHLDLVDGRWAEYGFKEE